MRSSARTLPQLLVWEMFKKTFTARQFLGVQTLAGALYLINPYTITWGSYTLETNLFLSQAAVFLVLAELVRLGRFVRAGQPFRWYDAALLGVGIGLSDPLAFPNMVRLLAIELGLLLIFTVAILYFLRSRAQREAEWTSAKRITVATFPIAILLLSYALYTFLESWLLNPASLSTVEYIDRNSIVSNNFGPMINILRLWGKQNFLSYPYGPAFLHSPLLIGASLLWPVLALAIPLLVSPYVVRVDRLWTLSRDRGRPPVHLLGEREQRAVRSDQHGDPVRPAPSTGEPPSVLPDRGAGDEDLPGPGGLLGRLHLSHLP